MGRELIDMPLFREPEFYVNVPLEQTYMAAYLAFPSAWKRGARPGDKIVAASFQSDRACVQGDRIFSVKMSGGERYTRQVQ